MATRNTIIAAVSNLSTAYNLTVISIVKVLIQNQYCEGKCESEAATAATACLVGAIVGQLSFGYIGDCLGRSIALRLTMALSILGALLSAFAVPITDDLKSIFYFLSATRFVLGVGVGGVYPLSATIASESATNAKSRGRTASLVFSMQGVANLLVPLVALAFVQLPDGNATQPSNLGLAWRLCLGIGAVPGILVAPFKTVETAKTSPALRTHVVVEDLSLDVDAARSLPFMTSDASLSSTTNTAGASTPLDDRASVTRPAPPSSQLTLVQALRRRSYWGKLAGCAGGWFLFDITFYGNQLFQTPVLDAIFAGNNTNHDGPHKIEGDFSQNRALQVRVLLKRHVCPVHHRLLTLVPALSGGAQMTLVALIALPGYYVAVAAMDRLGRRNIQLQGFFFMALTFVILWIWFDDMPPPALLILYGLTFFFSNFGPNSTTFILPSETFPAEVRTTLNGFCAAMGKTGAAIGSAAFEPLKEAVGIKITLGVCGVVSICGLIVTFLFVEDRRKLGMEGEVSQGPLLIENASAEKPRIEGADRRN